jgi:hypothetical protein
MRRFPSFEVIVTQARHALLRFPLALAAGLMAAVVAILLVGDPPDEERLARLLMTAVLGIPLFFALAIFVESRPQLRPAGGVALLLQGLGLLALALYYVLLPEPLRESSAIRFVQLVVGLHLLVAFLPYVGIRQDLGFWQFNKTLFLRFLAAVLFSATLFAGLSVALLALDQLLGIDIDDRVYPRLWFCIAFVFNTWYFAGGVPERLRELDAMEDYPKVLKVFAQYILAPLVAVYLAILTIYLVKVVVTTQWPSGWIGWLVSSVAAAGILSLALLHPLVKRGENGWIRSYSRAFYLLLLPAIVMLLMAIFKRIAQYGITEKRYLLTVLALWLAGIALYFLLSRRKSLKLIPLSLCLVAFLSAAGPWGAFSVSRRSQLGRLETMLVRNQRLVDGLIVPREAPIPEADRSEMSAVLDYLVRQHGAMALAAWYDDSLSVRVASWQDSESMHRNPREQSAAIMAYLGSEYLRIAPRGPDHSHHRLLARGDRLLPVAGFDLAAAINVYDTRPDSLRGAGEAMAVQLLEDGPALQLRSGERSVLEIPLAPTLAALRTQTASVPSGSAPLELMSVERRGAGRRVRLIIRDIHWRIADDGPVVEHLEGLLLIANDDEPGP